MNKRLSLAEQWDDFSLKVELYNKAAIQRKEMRRAFYAGAASILNAMMVGLDPGSEPTQADLDYLTAMSDEMRKFGLDIAAGKA